MSTPYTLLGERRDAAASGTQTAPIDRVVPSLRRVVEDQSVLGFPRGGRNELLERHVRERRTGDELVQRVDISLVVLTVGKPKRLRRDNRVERVLGAG